MRFSDFLCSTLLTDLICLGRIPSDRLGNPSSIFPLLLPPSTLQYARRYASLCRHTCHLLLSFLLSITLTQLAFKVSSTGSYTCLNCVWSPGCSRSHKRTISPDLAITAFEPLPLDPMTILVTTDVNDWLVISSSLWNLLLGADALKRLFPPSLCLQCTNNLWQVPL